MSYDPKNSLRFWPLESMTRFGQNPYGENLWRIVHAPSRRSLVHDRGRKPQWMVTYPQAGNNWVLEKWLSAYEFTKCTPEAWNMSMVFLGPYPEQGEYELAHIFNVMPRGEVEKIITLIQAGRKYSAYENSVSLRDDMDRDAKEGKQYREAVIRNALPAFGNAPMSGPGGGRGTKTFDLPLTAQQAGLPTGMGHITQRQGKKKYDVSELITA
jgi:hypothetical protein